MNQGFTSYFKITIHRGDFIELLHSHWYVSMPAACKFFWVGYSIVPVSESSDAAHGCLFN